MFACFYINYKYRHQKLYQIIKIEWGAGKFTSGCSFSMAARSYRNIGQMFGRAFFLSLEENLQYKSTASSTQN